AQRDISNQLLFSGVKFPTDKARISGSKRGPSAAGPHADILIFNRFGHRFHLGFVDGNVVNFEADAVDRRGAKDLGNGGFETHRLFMLITFTGNPENYDASSACSISSGDRNRVKTKTERHHQTTNLLD